MARVEEEYSDVLQNIEFAIVTTYRECHGMTDYDVMRVLEAVIDAYKGEKIGRPPTEVPLTANEDSMLERVRAACQWRLGRGTPDWLTNDGAPEDIEPLTVDQIILCLKRLLKSVKWWNKDGGRTGYLDYVVRFVK